MKIEGMILAAGSGVRMGAPKALTTWKNDSFLQIAMRAFRQPAMLAQIHIVLGDQAEDILQHMNSHEIFSGSHAVINEDYKSGLMSSLQAGLRGLSSDADAVLISLVDLPLLQEKTLETFLTAAENEFLYCQKTLARPYVLPNLTPGHPVFIHRIHFAEILMQPKSDQGAGFLFEKYPSMVFRFTTRDHSVAQDIDTPEAFKSLAEECFDRGPF